jgi:hypothetical protein
LREGGEWNEEQTGQRKRWRKNGSGASDGFHRCEVIQGCG